MSTVRTVLTSLVPALAIAALGLLLYLGGGWLDARYVSTFLQLGGLGLIVVGVLVGLVTGAVLATRAVRRRRR